MLDSSDDLAPLPCLGVRQGLSELDQPLERFVGVVHRRGRIRRFGCAPVGDDLHSKIPFHIQVFPVL